MDKILSNRRWWAALLVAALLALPAAPAFAIDRGPDRGVHGLTAWLDGALTGLAAPFGGLFAATGADTTCEPDQCVDVDGTCCECSADGTTCEDPSGGTDPGGPGGFVDPNG